MENHGTVILIPSYEPNETLPAIVQELSNRGYRIFVINDGSGKEFNKFFNECKPFAEVDGYLDNRGKGSAMKYGYLQILKKFPDCKYIITVDGDGQHHPDDVDKVNEELIRTNHLVFGVRNFGPDTPFRSKFGNFLSRLNRSLLTKEYLTDDQCGLRGFPVRYVPDLVSLAGKRYEYEMNQVVTFQMKKYPIFEVSIQTIYEPGNPTSHFQVFKDTVRIHKIIFLHAWISILAMLISLACIIFLFYINGIPDIYKYMISMSTVLPVVIMGEILFYSSNRLFKRIGKEFLFFIIRFIVGTSIFAFLHYLLHVWLIPNMLISSFLSCFMNYLVSYTLCMKRNSKINKIRIKHQRKHGR